MIAIVHAYFLIVLNAYPRAEHTRLAEDHDNSRKKRRRLANGEMVLNLVANNHQAVTINHNHQGNFNSPS